MVFRALHDLDSTEGTVQLVEAANRAHAHKGSTDIILVPQPSTDPNDPLLLPQWRKNVAFCLVCLFAFLSNFAIGGLAPAFVQLSEEFSKDIADTALLLTYCILCLGLGNFFWVPNAIYFGKRPVFVIACAIFFACTVWSAAAQGYQSLMAARLISAVAGGSTEALGAAIVNDIYYLHERGSKLGIYMIALSTGNSIGPLINGFMVTSASWRWFNWLAAILCGINLVFVVFMVPETRYVRSYNAGITELGNQAAPPAESGAVPVSSKGDEHFEEVENASGSFSGQGHQRVPKKKSYWQQLALFSGTPKGVSYFALWLRPFPFIAYPAVIFGLITYALSLVSVVAVNDLNAFVYQAPPYNFSAAINGLLNIPSLIGNLVGCFTSGWLMDKVAERHARKANGVFTPESRLPLICIPWVLVPTGLLMFGFAAQKHLAWAVGYVGYGFIATGLSGTANIGMIYVMDSYYPVAAECLLLINGLKNVIAFGFLHGVVPWVTEDGYEKAFGTLAALYIVIVGTWILMYIYGARMRHYTSTRWKLISWPLEN